LLFTGSRVVLVPAEPVAVGSPASGEEGFAPAGFVFADDVTGICSRPLIQNVTGESGILRSKR
jgi:hypothetical protein